MSDIASVPIVELKKKAGRYVAQLRKSRGLTQRELAANLGYAYWGFVSQVENGIAKVPPDKIRQWANALTIRPDWFAKTLLSYYEPEMYACIFDASSTIGATCIFEKELQDVEPPVVTDAA